jgi:mannose-6-phosphate isomerase-like protein (cupin superfamily)
MSTSLARPVPAVFETEGAIRVDIRAEALINHAFLRVIHTGAREQIAVMALPPYSEIGDQVRTETDQLLIFVEGNGEARVADYDLAVEPGDLVFVEAGTRHDIINRATIPLRLITVFAPPAYAPGSVLEKKEVREPPVADKWRPFP